MTALNEILTGAIASGSTLVGLFFLRFWRRTGDRFFLYFAFSFWLEAGNRLAVGLIENSSESEPIFYLLRVVAYGLIILAIVGKNRRAVHRTAPSPSHES